MKFLLPHNYKIVGAILAPFGFGIWVAMQRGYIAKMLVYFLGESANPSPYHYVNVAIAMISFFSFLTGLYFLTFSKEEIEDEMVQKTRLDSFQFAAFVQIAAIISGFMLMLFAGDPGESIMLLFFVLLVMLFWLSFIARFNYVLHIKLRQ